MTPDCNPNSVPPHPEQPTAYYVAPSDCGCVSKTPEPPCLHDRIARLERIVALLREYHLLEGDTQKAAVVEKLRELVP